MFTDHAILQQNQPIPIWGNAPKGTKVTVIFGKANVKAVADTDGRWQVVLPSQKATFGGKTLTVKAGKEHIVLHDIVVGEVWVAAGQSNMEYTMKLYKTFQKPYKVFTRHPKIRSARLAVCSAGSRWLAMTAFHVGS